MKSISTKMSEAMEDLRLEVLQSAAILSKGEDMKAAGEHPDVMYLPRRVEGCIEGHNEGNIQDCHQDNHVPDLKCR